MSISEPDFHLLREALFNRPTPRIPFIELGIHPTVKTTILGSPFQTISDDIWFMRKMGYDFIKIQPRVSFDFNRQQLTDQPHRSWSAEHEGLITNQQQFENYKWPQAEDIDYSVFEEARSQVPENMGVIGQYGDIFTSVWELMGFEAFALAIYEDPALIEALFERVGTLIISMFEHMAEMDWVGVLWYSDDIAYVSGPMVSPAFLRQHFFPLLKQIGRLAANQAKPFIYHTDGDVRSIMEDIIDSGVTALHPIEPKSMNIAEIKQKYGDRLCLCGGIDLDMLTRGDPDEVVRTTNEMIDLFENEGGYCLGSSNSIPDYINIRNYKLMLKTALERRKTAD
jgi:uroporphyrinogen decarboxylase